MKSRSLLVAMALLTALPLLATPAPKKLKARVARARAAHTLPVIGAGYAPIFIGEAPQKYVGEPISLDLKDADIRDVLLTFSRLARLNMVIDPDVRGSVTVRLESVPWDQALDVILKVNGLGYVLEGTILRVGSPTKL
ncbi:MAG TPA: secretin and TonB N-terminal domain-containing protein [Thermoanaerobaculia bacterium]|nr:secretin and TonB N-terminal domain-containing protein [Thermoanaerobaculia bacterium]